MYKTHGVAVQQYSQRSAENMADVILMVVLSIQQNWLGVGDQIADVRKNKIDSKFLWGNKIHTYKYLQNKKPPHYVRVFFVILDVNHHNNR